MGLMNVVCYDVEIETIKDAFSYHGQLRKLNVGTSIFEVENSSYFPLIFAGTGGSTLRYQSIKKFSQKSADEKNERY